MNRWNVLLLTLDDNDAALERLSQALQSSWSGEPSPAFHCRDADSLDPSEVQRFDAAVITSLRMPGESILLQLLSAFEDASVPVLALAPGVTGPGPEAGAGAGAGASNAFSLTGSLILPVSAEPPIVAATLHGLLHRQREVCRLREEIAVAQRFQGGLNGEMAKLHDELRLAATVQREMLPRHLPQLHGFQFSAMWRPVNYVSGDIYEITQLDDDHVGIFLADAVGHGVPAALMTMVLCHNLHTKDRSQEAPLLHEPRAVLAQLNAAMIERKSDHTRFATAVYGVLDCRRRVLSLAGAGHPPPLVLKTDGSWRELVTEGGLLGVFADETYPQIQVPLDEGDRLFFFSDGFEQAFPGAAGSGSEQPSFRAPTTRYREEFSRLAQMSSAQHMIESLSMSLDTQHGSLHQVDDLTLICAVAGPPPQAGDDAQRGPAFTAAA